jgi:hypothetical protein
MAPHSLDSGDPPSQHVRLYRFWSGLPDPLAQPYPRPVNRVINREYTTYPHVKPTFRKTEIFS